MFAEENHGTYGKHALWDTQELHTQSPWKSVEPTTPIRNGDRPMNNTKLCLGRHWAPAIIDNPLCSVGEECTDEWVLIPLTLKVDSLRDAWWRDSEGKVSPEIFEGRMSPTVQSNWENHGKMQSTVKSHSGETNNLHTAAVHGDGRSFRNCKSCRLGNGTTTDHTPKQTSNTHIHRHSRPRKGPPPQSEKSRTKPWVRGTFLHIGGKFQIPRQISSSREPLHFNGHAG